MDIDRTIYEYADSVPIKTNDETWPNIFSGFELWKWEDNWLENVININEDLIFVEHEVMGYIYIYMNGLTKW